MSKAIQGIQVVNQSLRTLLMLAGAGVAAGAGWLGYSQFVVPAQQTKAAVAKLEALQTQFTTLQADFDRQAVALKSAEKEKQRLATSLKLLKIDRRMANIKVLEKGLTESGEPFMDVAFWEVDSAGEMIGQPKPFRLRGEKLYLDSWIVKFEDQYVEQGDPLRQASLCVFKGIWGELDGPVNSYSLDRESMTSSNPPGIYNQPATTNEFEANIWKDFWSVANDPIKQKELGIRANHGQVNYVAVEKDAIYQVELRSSGGVSLKPLDE